MRTLHHHEIGLAANWLAERPVAIWSLGLSPWLLLVICSH